MSILTSVDLPAPFGPSTAQIIPDGISKEIPATAVKVPKVFVKSRQAIIKVKSINNDGGLPEGGFLGGWVEHGYLAIVFSRRQLL